MESRVFEMRTYYALPGRMEALHARFRDHTCMLFERHGINIVGFWTPMEPEEAGKRLIYLLSYPDRAAAEQSWASFQSDPEWQAAKADSERDAPIVERIESVFLNPSDYSPLT